MKIIVLGTTEFTVMCTKALLEKGFEVQAIVCLTKDLLPNNSINIKEFSDKENIEYYETSNLNSKESVEFLKKHSPDYIFSSWPKIIKKEVLELPKYYVIGTHCTELPYNRGRHPLHWLTVLGMTETMLSFFVMDEGADTGNLLMQFPYKLGNNIKESVEANNKAGYEGTKKLCDMLLKDPAYRGETQDQSKANYWRKRTPHDITIDPRMSTDTIIKTVNSFTKPYPCAKLIIEDKVLKIIKAEASKTVENLEHGKVVDISDGKISFKVADGIIELEVEGKIPEVEYVHPSTYYFSKHKISLE